MGQKVLVREIDNTTYTGTLINFSFWIMDGSLPRAIIVGEKGFFDSVPIDRIQLIKDK